MCLVQQRLEAAIASDGVEVGVGLGHLAIPVRAEMNGAFEVF